jgi:uncharacterized protein YecT (DUF1311 family)
MLLSRLIAVVSIFLLASVAYADDQSDQVKSCDGNTHEMVECLEARTTQWDTRMTAAYQQTLKDAGPQQREHLRAAQRLWINIATPVACITGWARAPSPGSMLANACAA